MKELLDMNRIPQHIAIIMDGNGRWATERGLDRTFGHKAGLDTVKKITAECSRLGVKYLTLYTFSTENWKRPAYEIEALMGLVLNFLEMELFSDNNVKFRMVGDLESLPESVQEKIHYMEDLTSKYDGMTLVVALSYSSRLELSSVTRQIAKDVKDGKLSLSMKALEEGGDDRNEDRAAAPKDYKLPKSEDISTNLGSLLKGIKLN